MRQFAWAGRRGARVHAVPAADGDVRAVAFSAGRRLGMVVVNLGIRPRSIVLDLGERAGTLASRVTSGRQDFAAAPREGYAGRPIDAVLEPRSVTTWILSAGSG